MCTYCRTCSRKVEKIEGLIRDIQNAERDNIAEAVYDYEHRGFNCCLGGKGALLDAILDAIKFLGIEEV